MALNPTSYGDNPQQPSISAEVFVPDQLIAGVLHLVSDNVLISGGAAFKRGTLMGLIASSAGFSSAIENAPGNTGNGVVSAVATTTNTRVGRYQLTFSAPTAYTVTDPAGNTITAGTSGAYSDAEIGWTFTAGSVAMVAGDTIDVNVSAGGGTYTKSVSTASDGSQTPIAVLADDADATGGTVNGGVYLHGEFNIRAVTFGAGINEATAKASLAARGIFLKGSVSAADPG
jgi:hypothetical protein